MRRTRFCKNRTVSIIGLTWDEYDILHECLSRCQDVMAWDDEAGYAEDGDNFIWRIEDRKDFDTLQDLRI